MSASEPTRPPLRAGRAMLLGLALMPLLVAWNYYVEVVFYTFATYAAPFYNVVAILFVLATGNRLLARFAPRLSLSAGELIIVYIMLSLQGALCSHNMMEILITLLAHPWKYATPENKWAELFLERLPHWAMISRPEVFEDYYLGNSTFWVAEHWRGWVRPTLVWSSFTTILVLTMLAINVILRRRWIEHERLSYPVLQLPLAIVNRPQWLFSSRMMWAGFTVAALLSLVAGLHELLPAVPEVPVGRHGMAAYFTTKPWTVLRGMRWAIYPWAIGIMFLIPLDLSVSCWLFYGLFLAQRVVGEQFGWSRAGGFPWSDDQAFGAYLAILAMGVWIGRDHFVRVFRDGLSLWRRPAESEDRLYRLAVWATVAGIGYLTWFGTRVGIGGWLSLAFFLVYFALAVMITRIRAEMGFPTHDMHHMNPRETFTRLVPPHTFRPNDLVGFQCFFWFNRVYASHPMPHQLEAFKMADEARCSARPIGWAMVLAACVAPLFVFLILPHFYYQIGSESAHINEWGTQFGRQAFGELAGWLQSERRPDPANLVATVAGFAIALGIGAVRVRLIGWPLHPLAYAIANSWGVEQLWLPLIVASGLKWAMLRTGGLPLYRRWIPFFLGLILGDFVAGSLWNVAGMIGHFHPYDFWPGVIK